ncbi:MAG TPA: hypothetical protein PLL74_08760, partial [Bacteroidales bacterium]|nr:hypothetical protein [Bacteroidales bacterium]
LFSEKYVSTSDELFNICAVTAAVFVDSALYWDENINEWIDSQTDDVSTKCLDWDYLWSLIEPIIYADAEAAVAAAYIGAWLGPLDAVVIAAAAAIASIFACMTSVAP